MRENASGLIILGFGGHARSVADVAWACGFREMRFVDAGARDDEQLLGFPVERSLSGPLPDRWLCFPATGDNRRRKDQVAYASSQGWPLATLISPHATIGIGADVTPGTVVGHHAHVGPMARIGAGCIINTAALVEHESVVGDFCHVSVNATVAGRCKIGAGVYLGAGSTVIHNCELADNVTVGAGGVVIASLTEAGTYVGSPVRKLDPITPVSS